MRNIFKALCRIGLSFLIASLMLSSATFAQPEFNVYEQILAELEHRQVTPLPKDLKLSGYNPLSPEQVKRLIDGINQIDKEFITSYGDLKVWSQSEFEDDYILEGESELYSSLHMSAYTFEDLGNGAPSEYWSTTSYFDKSIHNNHHLISYYDDDDDNDDDYYNF